MLRRALRGSAWVLSGTLVAALATTGVMLVLAGLLTPAEFGLVAVALVVYEGASAGLSPGLGQAVQSLPRARALDQTALALALVVGALTAAVGLPLAPLLVRALGVPEAGPLAMAVLLAVAPRRWNEVRIGQIERDLTFARPGAIVAIAAVVAGALSIGVALAGGGAWALLTQVVAAEVLTAAGLTLFGPTPRTPRISRTHLRELWSFGKQLMGSSVAVFGYTNIDDAIVARMSGPVVLGVYSFAYRIANIAVLVVTRPVQRVLLPILRSREPERWPTPYLRATQGLAWVSGLATGAVGVLGPPILDLLYEDRWAASHAPLRVLAVYGALRAIGALTGTVFVAAGQPARVRRIATWQLIALATVIVPAVAAYEATGAALAVTTPLAGGVFYALVAASRIVGVPTMTVLIAVVVRWATSLAIMITGLMVQAHIGGWPGAVLAAAVITILVAGLTFGTSMGAIRAPRHRSR
jgi:lipopolysaccharide exporter